MSIATDINKIMDECRPFLKQANTVQTEMHKVDKDNLERRCRYELIYCFYDGIKNNYYHVLIRICKCGLYKDLTSWLDNAHKGYMDMADLEEGTELHLNKSNSERDCKFEITTNPHDIKETTYLLRKRFCECPRHVQSYLR